jgi:hypothetical protein
MTPSRGLCPELLCDFVWQKSGHPFMDQSSGHSEISRLDISGPAQDRSWAIITNRWSCRLEFRLMREDFVCCGSPGSMRRRLVWFAGLIRRRSSTLCYDHNTSAGIVDIDLEYRYSTLKAGSLILMMACID